MQFDPEETGEARRQRQRDYHAFLDAQVQARRKPRPLEVPTTDNHDVQAARFPSLPLSGRLKHQASPPPYGVDPAAVGAARRGRDVGRVSRSLDDGSGAESRDRIGIASDREEYLNRLENRLEGEVQRRYLVERKIAVLGQKVMAGCLLKLSSTLRIGPRWYTVNNYLLDYCTAASQHHTLSSRAGCFSI